MVWWHYVVSAGKHCLQLQRSTTTLPRPSLRSFEKTHANQWRTVCPSPAPATRRDLPLDFVCALHTDSAQNNGNSISLRHLSHPNAIALLNSKLPELWIWRGRKWSPFWRWKDSDDRAQVFYMASPTGLRMELKPMRLYTNTLLGRAG